MAKAAPATPAATPASDKNKHQGNSRAVVKSDLKLETTPAQKVWDRHFLVVSANLYQMTVMLPILSSISIAQKAEEVIDRYMDETVDGLKKEIARMQIIMNQNQIADLPEYTHPVTHKVEITSPHAGRFSHIIRTLDDCCKHIEAVWMGGQLSATQKNQAVYHAGNRVARLGGRIRNLNNSFKSILQKGKDATLDDFVEAGHSAAAADAADEAADSAAPMPTRAAA